jgi:hypothetical protein
MFTDKTYYLASAFFFITGMGCICLGIAQAMRSGHHDWTPAFELGGFGLLPLAVAALLLWYGFRKH